MMNKNGFSRCGENYINRLRKEGRYSTAHVYKNALYSFGRYCGTLNVSFKQVTKERLRRYGQYLYECGLKPNTISTYMRMLRSIYNRGVDMHQAPYVHGLFRDVFYRGGHTSEESYPDRRTSHAIKQRSSIGKASSDAGHCQSVISVLWNAFF